jgi:peptide/bleomycin uptake transporter
MFKFFQARKYLHWSILGTTLIISMSWWMVQLDLQINQWFGEFYDVLQKALTTPGSVTEQEFIGLLFTFASIAALWVVISTAKDFFTSHWIFRWRTSMTEYYHANYHKASNIEGASQRVQEDTLKFARLMETLGIGLLDSALTLIAFLPILWGLSQSITMLPWVGEVQHGLVWVAMLSALGGTIVLAIVGFKLPGIEYDIQKEEAAYRKRLVLSEGDFTVTEENSRMMDDLYARVRKVHYRSYFHYMYFNMVRWSYFQGMVIVPYVALAPTIAGGLVTLGVVQQIVRAFGRVETSLQYLVKSWPTIVELISVVKRLREFEKQIKQAA